MLQSSLMPFLKLKNDEHPLKTHIPVLFAETTGLMPQLSWCPVSFYGFLYAYKKDAICIITFSFAECLMHSNFQNLETLRKAGRYFKYIILKSPRIQEYTLFQNGGQ